MCPRQDGLNLLTRRQLCGCCNWFLVALLLRTQPRILVPAVAMVGGRFAGVDFGAARRDKFQFLGIELFKQPFVPQVEAARRLLARRVPLLPVVEAPAGRSAGPGTLQVVQKVLRLGLPRGVAAANEQLLDEVSRRLARPRPCMAAFSLPGPTSVSRSEWGVRGRCAVARKSEPAGQQRRAYFARRQAARRRRRQSPAARDQARGDQIAQAHLNSASLTWRASLHIDVQFGQVEKPVVIGFEGCQ